jgi:DNA processing protein
MTLDHAVALSMLTDLPRPGLTARLQASDPDLIARADALAAPARRLRERAAQAGIGVVAWNDDRFPASLLAIPDCPPALWYRGSLACLAVPAVAIVGSRAASPTALEVASRLASELAARGVTVVSGLARGVDSAAHRAALETGSTAAVLGSGLDRIYPPEHAPLADSIAGRGIVVTEYAPGTPPLPGHFPMRNRVISGLSRATVVIEASHKSGSLITAACALEQGREVMAVPGTVLGGRNAGGHALIRDGARIVECADDILEELGLGSRPGPGAPAEASRTGSAGSQDPVLRAMDEGEAYDLDALADRSGIDVRGLLPRLIDLELSGLVRRADGGRFVRQTRTC